MLRGSTRFNGIIEPITLPPGEGTLLAGLTFAAKDLFDVAGYVTGAGIPDWKRTHAAATSTASAIESLLAAGATLVGKACTDELAFSLDGINCHYGTPENPNRPGAIPGGSSSGSAAAVALGVCDLALGTDTGGSVRVPAAFCGVLSMRPTHGSVSDQGLTHLAPSFDTVGWFARSANHLKQCAKALFDKDAQKPGAEGTIEAIYLLDDAMDLLFDDLKSPFRTAVEKLAGLSVVKKSIRLPGCDLEELASVFGSIRSYEAWQLHGEWIETTRPAMAPATLDRFMQCKNVSLDDCRRARQRQEEIRIHLSAILQNSLFVLPPIWHWPPSVHAPSTELEFNRRQNLLLASTASLCGFPQVTIPIDIGADSAFALSFVGAPHSDFTLLDLADRVFSQIGFTGPKLTAS